MKKVYVVGLGPGGREYMTEQAACALRESQVLCGYTVYIDLIAPDYPGKRVLTTPMTQETLRCRMALETAAAGETVALVCSGDAGVYGMAGPLLELAPSYPDVEVEVVAGVTAALSGAALLGAPLMHDFAVISLSDLLTPWEQIAGRLRAAAGADFCICLYNVSSRRRAGYLARACSILLETLPESTQCGWVRCIGRQGQQSGLLTLGQLQHFEADMFTTVYVGKSTTHAVGGRMVTPRGYENKRGGGEAR